MTIEERTDISNRLGLIWAEKEKIPFLYKYLSSYHACMVLALGTLDIIIVCFWDVTNQFTLGYKLRKDSLLFYKK